MPHQRSLHTEAVIAKAAELRRMDEYAERHRAVPFMEERLALREEATRVRDMAPQERMAWVQQVGQEHALQVAKHLSRRQANG